MPLPFAQGLYTPPPRWAWPSGARCVLGGCKSGRPFPLGQLAHTHTGAWICVAPLTLTLPADLDALEDTVVASRPGWVLRHEIAHLLTGHHGHTRVWTMTYTLLGAGPDIGWQQPAPARLTSVRWARVPMAYTL